MLKLCYRLKWFHFLNFLISKKLPQTVYKTANYKTETFPYY